MAAKDTERIPKMNITKRPVDVPMVNAAVGALYAVGRAWFMLNVGGALLSTYLAGKAIHFFYFWGTWDQKCGLTLCSCGLSFKIAYALSPWMKFEDKQELNITMNELRLATRSCGGALLMTNHTSFMDAFVTSMLLPFDIIYKCRTLAKSSLFKIPILGEVFRLSGHFPVYFQGSVNFAVDREKQKKVSEATNKFLKEGGIMLFCPEGQVERDTPHKIQSLRRGSFSLAAEHNLPIFTFIMAGNCEIWPVEWMFGGLPGTVNLRSRCVVSPKELRTRAATKALTEDEVKAKTIQLATHTQQCMQEDVDFVFEATGRRERFGAEYDNRLRQILEYKKQQKDQK